MNANIKQAAKSWIYAAPSFVVDFVLFWLLNSFILVNLKNIPFNFGPFRYSVQDGGLCTFLSTAISYFASMFVNYTIQRKYVFKSNVNYFKGLCMYALSISLSYIVVLLLPGFIGGFFNSIFGHDLGSIVTKLISELIGFCIHYPIDKKIILK